MHLDFPPNIGADFAQSSYDIAPLFESCYDVCMSVRMRHTRSHTGNRRSHHRLQTAAVAHCARCRAVKVAHTVCTNCGAYNGRELIDVMKKLTKKERKAKAKELAEQEEKERGNRPLDAAALSKKS